MPQMKGQYTTFSSWHIDHSTLNIQHSTFNNLLLFHKLFTEISCGFENKVVTLRHGFLIQMIMKQVEERYISLLTDFGFDRLFEEAEIAKFTPQEMREYETSKMAYRDIKNSVDTAKREGLAEGIEIGMNQKAQDIAKNMLAMGLSAEQVAKATQLSLEIIKNLSNSKKIKFRM